MSIVSKITIFPIFLAHKLLRRLKSFAVRFVAFCLCETFCKKIKTKRKKSNLEIALITSFHYTTDVYRINQAIENLFVHIFNLKSSVRISFNL